VTRDIRCEAGDSDEDVPLADIRAGEVVIVDGSLRVGQPLTDPFRQWVVSV